jgi:hypothetical protein
MTDLQVLININSVRESKSECLKFFSQNDLQKLVNEGILSEETVLPSRCEFGCGELMCMQEGNKIISRCPSNHRKEEPLEKYIIYEINFQKIIDKIFSEKFELTALSTFRAPDKFNYLAYKYKDDTINLIFSPSTRIKEAELFGALGTSLSSKIPTILLAKSTLENKTSVDSILFKMPLGNLLYPCYLEDLKNTKLIGGLKEWLSDITSLQQLERTILNQMKDMDEKRFQLINSIDTNPKFLLSFLTKLKAQKLRDVNDYSEFENILAITFRSIYSSAIQYGGTQQTGERVPDNVFFVRTAGKFSLAGIVDGKFSYSTDLSKEKTEKYLHYIEKVRNHPFINFKKALIFVILKEKSEGRVKEFSDRLDKYLKEDEYCIILPAQVLEILVYVYLGSTIRGKINLGQEDLNAIFEKIFDRDFLITKKDYVINKQLFKLKPDILIDELKKRSITTSSLEIAFSEIFKEYTAE